MHETIFLPVVLYGCEIMLLMLKEECRHRAFEHRVLRRIFGHLERESNRRLEKTI
jgi:hypothetical protein